MPRTLIHYDFNSRNITFKRIDGSPQLIAYDWELATIHLPQRDIAELLSFALSDKEDQFDENLVESLVEQHRLLVEQESGKSLDKDLWRQGFLYSLYDFLIYRLSIYSIGNHYKPCSFWGPTYHTVMRLIELFEKKQR